MNDCEIHLDTPRSIPCYKCKALEPRIEKKTVTKQAEPEDGLAYRIEQRLRQEAERAKGEFLGSELKAVHDARVAVWYEAARLSRMVVEEEARRK